MKELHERNKYEDLQFPVGLYEVNRYRIIPEGRGFRDLHWHEELQYSMVKRGSIVMQVNGVRYEMNEGDCILINKNLLHITQEISDDGEYFSVNFPDKLLGFYTGSRMEMDNVRTYTNNYLFPALIFNRYHAEPGEEWKKEIANQVVILEKLLLDKPNLFQYRVSTILTDLWYRIISNVGEIEKPSKSYIRRQERMQQMLAFIHTNYMDDILLSDIASAGGVSAGECSRCFKNTIDESPNQYLLNYRISKSIENLTGTDKSITEIAFDCGFNDSSHFIQYFKKKTGMTPQRYREQ